MCQINQRPCEQTLLELYPSLYRIDNIAELPEIASSENSGRRNSKNNSGQSTGQSIGKGDGSSVEPSPVHQPSENRNSNEKGDHDRDDSSSSTSDSTSDDGSIIDWETPNFLPLSAEMLSSNGMFLLDIGDNFILWIGQHVSFDRMRHFFGKSFPNELKEFGQELPEIPDSLANCRLRQFIEVLRTSYGHRPFYPSLRIVRDDTNFRRCFITRLLHDRIGDEPSYYDFLTHIKNALH